MEDINFNDTLLTVLRNIELNTAQQASTPQNVDIIQTLTLQPSASSNLGVNPSVTSIADGLRGQCFYFPIPAETPFLIVPQVKRSLAFFRDSEQVPFAYVNAGQTRAFRLPHLQQLRVDVLPGLETDIINLYVSSRPYETPVSLQPSGYLSGFNTLQIAAPSAFYSPIISNVDLLSLGWNIRADTFDAGVTSVDVHVQAVDEAIAKSGGNGSLITLSGPTNVTPPFSNARVILTQPSRYFVFRITPNGAGNIALTIRYEFIK